MEQIDRSIKILGSLESRQGKLYRVIELTANAVIICALVLAGVLWLRRAAGNSSQIVSQNTSAPRLGSTLVVPGVDWHRYRSNIVIALSATCPHCISDAAFYSDLTRVTHHSQIIVVMPQNDQGIAGFHKQHKINPSRTLSANLASIQVSATPAILQVSSDGVVTRTWVGQLTDKEKQSVFKAADQL